VHIAAAEIGEEGDEHDKNLSKTSTTSSNCHIHSTVEQVFKIFPLLWAMLTTRLLGIGVEKVLSVQAAKVSLEITTYYFALA
jgi:hypothetical protein